MSLLAGLILRLVGVAIVCLGLAVGWVVVDTNRALQAETVVSADRIERQLKRRPWLGSANEATYRNGVPAREALGLITVLGPGICADIVMGDRPAQRLCNGADSLGLSAPAWFAGVFRRAFDPGPPVTRSFVYSGRGTPEATSLILTADPVPAMALAWRQVRLAAGMALAMALGMSLLTAVLLTHALRPAETIVRGIRRLAGGDYGERLPGFRTAEFRHIAEAFNFMGDRLERGLAERKALTRRLFEVQEDERRALARDLHDEFGQCLTAVRALAASVQAGAPADRPDLADDAARILGVTGQMMATLKGAFARLRPPDLDALGLEASLRGILRGWTALGRPRAEFHLETGGDLAALPPEASLSIYRIVQECITNAARHGNPSRVSVRVTRSGPDGVDVVVEDDGGGNPDEITAAAGFGVLGIRERLEALGGRFSFGRSEGGVRMEAFLPVGAGVAP